MPMRSRSGLSAVIAAAVTFVLARPFARAEESMSDEFEWLEAVSDERALTWVRQQNARAEAELAANPAFNAREAELRAILDSDAKIPMVQKIGAHYYNFWKDAQHERGLWRRTTLEEYRKPNPAWETVVDLDALNQAERENWVWHGAQCLQPSYERCLISLSRGGADADVTREFDLVAKQWVPGGFYRKEAKGGVSWIDRDHVYVFSDFGPGTTSTAGYPLVVKQWTRGTPFESASVIYQGKPDDMEVTAARDLAPGYERDFVMRGIAFYNDELYLRANNKLTKVSAPNSASKSVHHEWLTLLLRKPWTIGSKTYPEGSLLVAKFDEFMAGRRSMKVVFTPTETTSLASYCWTQNHLVLNVLEDVKHRLSVWTPAPGAWKKSEFVGAPNLGTVDVSPVDPDDSDAVWLTATDYLTPTTLALTEIGRAPEALKRMPAFFDASKHVAEQHFARSKDGTKVPYFLVRPKGSALDGSTPTLLTGYGGFEIALTPNYSGTIGKGWIERGGAYAVANIRGGGEYGPRWHQAALQSKRHKAYEDFAAVARDLSERKVTSPERLGIQGASNGGLLMGNMLTQYPELFGAVVVQVPLLDMRRYHKLLAGASWMAEYGDPDKPDQWRFIKTFSPYHLLQAGKRYPPTLFMTSTRDDRVHPGHARKMMAKMLQLGSDVRYYENIEGGHGGSANNQQAAHMAALAYAFLWKTLAR
jgi:prolyl oligopeptidase